MPTSTPYTPPPHQPSTPMIYPPEVTHTTTSMLDRQEIAATGHYNGYTHHEPGYGQYTPDPHAVTMEEYRQTEQHEQLYNSNYGNQPSQHDHYYREYRDEPDMTTPMVPPLLQHPSSQHTIQPEDPSAYQPAQHKHPYNPNNKSTPMLVPYHEAEAYRPKYYDDRSSGCNCCCYNPAMTCCSCFCFLISLAFLAGGIALIIAAKVIGDKCNAQCGDVVDKASSYGVSAQPCDAICGKVVHDGMFYGGIVVAGLAAIAAIWKIFMWMCAAGSRR
ncbi:hypothetical protein BC941DRAFT_445107 [Chlamydoabsidia padenii]|nr:hypothetical protein BC941DRAFT_445107 [Chlamydoabsidia padenii]